LAVGSGGADLAADLDARRCSGSIQSSSTRSGVSSCDRGPAPPRRRRRRATRKPALLEVVAQQLDQRRSRPRRPGPWRHRCSQASRRDGAARHAQACPWRRPARS
jgi:hypothetical protein